MRNLINFIARNSFFFLFLLMEIFCFYLIYQNNSFHQTAFINSSSEGVASLYRSYDNVVDYIDLKKVNKVLSEENALLRNHSLNSFGKVFGRTIHYKDTLYRQNYTYTSAKVINNTINKKNNFLTLDKGALHGIEPNMGVVGPNGIVGIVKDVSDHFCTVYSVLHKNFKTSGKINRNNYFGSVVWSVKDPETGKLLDVPQHVKLKKGDLITTTTYSLVFPENITIGTIKDFSTKEGSGFWDIDIEFGTDFQTLSYVYIIKYLMKDEQERLELNLEETDG